MMNMCRMSRAQKWGSELPHSTVKGKQELSAAPEELPPSLHSRAFQRSKLPYLVFKQSHTLSQM